MNRQVSKALWISIGVLSLIIAFGSYRYLAPSPIVPPDIGKNAMRHPWLIIHAGMAATALLVGPFQFLASLRARAPRLHRWIGRVYVVGCLVAGVAGVPLALGTDAGPIARYGFLTLAILWILITGRALQLAMTGRYAEHRQWMIRSFALTFAAVTLRLYLPIGPLLGYSFLEGYRITAWMAWVPNILAAELYLRSARRPSRAVAHA